MIAAYQPVPNLDQRRQLHEYNARRLRHYRDTQAIADFQAARLRYVELPKETVAAAGVACCDVEPDPVIREDFAVTLIGVAVLVFLAISFAWGIV